MFKLLKILLILSMSLVLPSLALAQNLNPSTLLGLAPLASPALTGTPTVNGTSISVTNSVNVANYANFSTAATYAVSVGKTLVVPIGSYSYTGSTLTVSVPVIFEPGAVLSCTSANIAFTGLLQAPRSQIFAAGCTPSITNVADGIYPEWWERRHRRAASDADDLGHDEVHAKQHLFLADHAAGSAATCDVYVFGDDLS